MQRVDRRPGGKRRLHAAGFDQYWAKPADPERVAVLVVGIRPVALH